MRKQRICIYSSDVQAITGKSARYSRKVLRQLRVAYKKEKHHLISYSELATYLDLKPEMVFKLINNVPFVGERVDG